MGAKNFLPRFNATGGTNPDIGSNTLTIHGEGSYGQGQNLTARWGTIFANQGNFTGNLSIGQGSLSTDSTSTTHQITFGDDFYIGQNNSATILTIGSGTDVSSNGILSMTSSNIVPSVDILSSSAITGSVVTGVTSLTGPSFLPTTANFILYEGTNDDHETTMTITDPTADRTITFPDASGTVAFTSDIPTSLAFDGSTANGVCTFKDSDEISVEPNLTWDGDDLNITSSTGAKPRLQITNTNTNSKPPAIHFIKDKGAAGALNDGVGQLLFKGDNASQSIISYGDISSTMIGVISGDESGQMAIKTASSNGTTSSLRNVITGVGSVSADTVTVDIGYGTGSTTTIAGNLDVDGELISSRTNLIITPGGTLEIDSTGDMTLDSSANIELNADGGDIDFKDGAAQLAKISSAGLSFVDNTGAGIIFEGDTDDAYQTTLTAADTTSSDKTITLPDATGTVQLQGENTGHVIHVNIRDNGSYLFYLFNDDSWYSAGSTTLAILGSSTAPSDISSANSEYQGRVGCYTAIADCTVKKLIFTFYWSSSVVNSADIDFAFSKFTPITDGTAASITMNAITATDCDGSYTEVKPYQKTFTFSGGNASLSAGDSFAFHMRTTGGSSSQRILVYGNAVLSLELD